MPQEQHNAAPGPGAATTEYERARSSSIWGIVAMTLGMTTTILPAVVDNLPADSNITIICGAIVAVAGIVQKTLADLGYIKSRTDVKVYGLSSTQMQHADE